MFGKKALRALLALTAISNSVNGEEPESRRIGLEIILPHYGDDACLGIPETGPEGEEVVTYDGGTEAKIGDACFGGVENYSGWNAHRPGENSMGWVTRFQIWKGGYYNGFTRICVYFSDGTNECHGEGKGGGYDCQHDVDVGDRLLAVELHRNANSLTFEGNYRVGGLYIKYRKEDGSEHEYRCGKKKNKHLEADGVADGTKQLAGFFGSIQKDNVNQLGVLVYTPSCTVVKQEVVKMKCVEDAEPVAAPAPSPKRLDCEDDLGAVWSEARDSRCCPKHCGDTCGASDCDGGGGGCCEDDAEGRVCGVDDPPCYLPNYCEPLGGIMPGFSSNKCFPADCAGWLGASCDGGPGYCCGSDIGNRVCGVDDPPCNFPEETCDEELKGDKGEDYRGCQSTTRNGYGCMRWVDADTQWDAMDKGGLHNYCRNPDGSETIWCYTTGDKRFDLCDPKETCDEDLLGDKGADYRGCQDTTVGGHKCMRWLDADTQWDGMDKGAKHNYCRNPDGSATIWCYTVDGPRFEMCVPKASHVETELNCKAEWSLMEGSNQETVTDLCYACGDDKGECTFDFQRKEYHTTATIAPSLNDLHNPTMSFKVPFTVNLKGMSSSDKEAQDFAVEYSSTWEDAQLQVLRADSSLENSCTFADFTEDEGGVIRAASNIGIGKMTAKVKFGVLTELQDGCGDPSMDYYEGTIEVENMVLKEPLLGCGFTELSCDAATRCPALTCEECKADDECIYTASGCVIKADGLDPAPCQLDYCNFSPSSGSTCCNVGCSACGGSGCDHLGEGCCSGTIQNNGRYCENPADAYCIIPPSMELKMVNDDQCVIEGGPTGVGHTNEDLGEFETALECVPAIEANDACKNKNMFLWMQDGPCYCFGDELASSGDCTFSETGLATWERYEIYTEDEGYDCGGTEIANLLDDTPSDWEGAVNECKAKCSLDPKCDAFVMNWEDGTCSWKADVTEDSLNAMDGYSCFRKDGNMGASGQSAGIGGGGTSGHLTPIGGGGTSGHLTPIGGGGASGPTPPACTAIDEGKVCAGERADDCKWLKQQKRCISNKVCEAQSKQVCKERADCEYNRVTTTCVDKGTVPCNEYLKAIECKAGEPAGQPLACFFNKDTKKCRDRECGDISGKKTCKKYAECVYDSGTCSDASP